MSKLIQKYFGINLGTFQAYEQVASDDTSLLELPKSTSSGLKSVRDIPWSNVLTMFINGTEIVIRDPNPTELLAGFIRDKAGLKGTKLGCEEGGCGACTVVLTRTDGTYSVNSCLRPLCANDGMAVTTVEGIGSIKNGLSSEQQCIVDNNGTQCGYCTPGWVSNMHALNAQVAETGVRPSERQLENYLDGNICRCTGYRSILKALKENNSACGRDPSTCTGHGTSSCSGDSSCEHAVELEDISGASVSDGARAAAAKGKKSTLLGSRRNKALVASYVPQPLCFTSPDGSVKWYRPIGVDQLCAIVRECSRTGTSIQLVGGNTSVGVSKYLNDTAPHNNPDKYSVFVDINCVPEMTVVRYDETTAQLTVGAAVTIHGLISLLNQYAQKPVESEAVNHRSVFSVVANHLTKVANTQVLHLKLPML